MPYKDEKKQLKAMREINRKARQRRKADFERSQRLIAQFQKAGVERRKERVQMLDIIQQTMFILDRTDLTDSEKVARISAIPIPEILALSMVKLLKEVTA